MTVYVTKIGNRYYQTTIEQSVETHTIVGNALTPIALDHDPIDPKQVVAVLYSPEGDRYPDLENYNLYPRNGADFDIIQPYAPTNTTYYFRWWASHLSSERFPSGSNLVITYDHKTRGNEVINDPNAVADAVWNRQRTSHNTSGSMGEAMTALIGLVDDIPGSVWNSLLGSHDQPGSFGGLLNDLVSISSPSTIATAVWNASINGIAAKNMIEFIYDVQGGRWNLDTTTNQMVLYKDNNTTEVARFNLIGADGSGTVTSVFERRRTTS